MAITRGVLSKGEATDIIVNIQEVTNDETPPAIAGAPSKSIATREGNIHSVISADILNASDRLGFSWSKVSGPTELTIDSSGSVLSSVPFSATAKWNTSGADATAVFRATDTAGNSSDIPVTFTTGMSSGTAADSWTSGSNTRSISYRASTTGDFTGYSNLFTNSNTTGWIELLNNLSGNNLNDMTFAISQENDPKIVQGISTSSSGTLKSLVNTNSTPPWSEGETINLVWRAISKERYYYAVNAAGTGQHVDDNGQNPEDFYTSGTNAFRLVHSSKASEMTISTGQKINVYAQENTTLYWPLDFLVHNDTNVHLRHCGGDFYAVNNGNGTISFADTHANAIAEPPVIRTWSGTAFGISGGNNMVYVAPCITRTDQVVISNDLTVTETAIEAVTTTPFPDGNNTADVYYHRPTAIASGGQSIVSLTTSGGSGQRAQQIYVGGGQGLEFTGGGDSRNLVITAQNFDGHIVTIRAFDQGGGSVTKQYRLNELYGVDAYAGLSTGDSDLRFFDYDEDTWSGGPIGTIPMEGGLAPYSFNLITSSASWQTNNISVNSSGVVSVDAGFNGSDGTSHYLVVSVTDALGNAPSTTTIVYYPRMNKSDMSNYWTRMVGGRVIDPGTLSNYGGAYDVIDIPFNLGSAQTGKRLYIRHRKTCRGYNDNFKNDTCIGWVQVIDDANPTVPYSGGVSIGSSLPAGVGWETATMSSNQYNLEYQNAGTLPTSWTWSNISSSTSANKWSISNNGTSSTGTGCISGVASPTSSYLSNLLPNPGNGQMLQSNNQYFLFREVSGAAKGSYAYVRTKNTYNFPASGTIRIAVANTGKGPVSNLTTSSSWSQYGIDPNDTLAFSIA